MEFALIVVVAIVTIVAVATFSKQLGIAAPLVLVVVGIGISLIPGIPAIWVSPDLVLEVLLPVLLYASAVRFPLMDFRRNLDSIGTLSVVLVIISALVVGLLLSLMLPGLNLAAAVALGAIVGPTDAVAATAMAKKLGLPGRIVTVLEGESLVNDASSLVLLKSAIGATAAAVSVWSVAGNFAYSVVVALLVGFAAGILTVFVRAKLRDPVLDTAISFAVPFIAFVPAEALGASGVLAVVVAGLYSGHRAPQAFTASSRISERLNWRTIQFIVENGVFLLMGLQLTHIVRDVPHDQLGVFGSVLIGALLVVVLMAIRSLVVAPLLVILRVGQRRASGAEERVSGMLERIQDDPEAAERRFGRRTKRATRFLERRSADLNERQTNAIGVRGGVVITWAGMRGVVTVAAAQSLPLNTPYRPQLILIAFTVAILTLLVQGGTLPWLIRLTGVRGTDAAAHKRELAALLQEMSEAGEQVLQDPGLTLADGSAVAPDVLDRLRTDVTLRSEAARERAEHNPEEAGAGPHQQYRELREQVLEAERQALLEARSRGAYSSRSLMQAQAVVDAEETRLAQRDTP